MIPVLFCRLGRKLLAVLVVLIIADTGSASAETSVSQYGITWTWTQDRQIGQFANGDWWVVGPITLTGPVSTNGQNGTMINPAHNYWAIHGFDSRITSPSYSPALNMGAQLPLTVAVNSSIVSATSYAALRNRNQLENLAVLTVLPSAPPAGSFRPPYLGTDKTVSFNKSQIDYTKLKKLPLVAGANRAYSENLLKRTMFNIGSAYTSNYLLGWNNTPLAGKNYGREITFGIARVGLELNLNYKDAEKETMAVCMIQHGIDIYGAVGQGLKFFANGGHQGSRKLAMAMAGKLLNNNAMLARCNRATYPDTFAEDSQHFYVTQNDINTPRVIDTLGGRPADPYPQSALGMPEWGADGGFPKNTAGYNWGRFYRDVCCPNFVGEAAAAKIAGLEGAWNHPAFFDYYKRYVLIERASGRIDAFMLAMWDVADSGTVSQPSAYVVGDKIEALVDTRVREGASLSGTLLGTQNKGSLGTIVGGPVSTDNIVWWQVNYDGGVDGWSGGDNFTKPTNSTAPAVFTPNGGLFAPRGGNIDSSPVNISLETTSSGSSIYYTTNGTTPDSGSKRYTTPFDLMVSLPKVAAGAPFSNVLTYPPVTVRAVAVRPGFADSPVQEAIFEFGPFSSGDEWLNIRFSPRAPAPGLSYFKVLFDYVPGDDLIDAVVGLSNGQATSYKDLACIIRFNTLGAIDCRNGETYAAANPVKYSKGSRYRVEMTVDMTRRTYCARVSANPSKQDPIEGYVEVAKDYAFRTESATAIELNNIALITVGNEVSRFLVLENRPNPIGIGKGGDFKVEWTP